VADNMDEIIQMVKDDLHINTTLDESSERRLLNETKAGMAYLRKFADSSLSFESGTMAGQLLCDYVLRAESGATETFAADFSDEIDALKQEKDASAYAKVMGYDSTT